MSIYDELQLLIDQIQYLYENITDIWEKVNTNNINFKKMQVRDIDNDGTIYVTVNQYVGFLNEQSSIILTNLQSSYNYFNQINARVKTQNSIELKIQNYKTQKHGLGKIPINKCLNDLFGLRIILKNPLTYKEIYGFIRKTYGNKYKCIDSSKLGYKATHLYFKKDNMSFQWELQIWNNCDRENNLSSHKKYKQEYTTWEKETKKGEILYD